MHLFRPSSHLGVSVSRLAWRWRVRRAGAAARAAGRAEESSRLCERSRHVRRGREARLGGRVVRWLWGRRSSVRLAEREGRVAEREGGR